MKCWLKYMLPLVIAVSVFLGSSFFSYASEAVQEVTSEGLGYEAWFLACKDDVQAVLDGRGFVLDDMYYYGYYDDALDQIKVYITNRKLVCDSCSDTSFIAQERSLTMYLAVVTTDCKLLSCTYHYYSMNTNISFPLNSTSFSSYDIYDEAGDLFFQGPSPFQRVVRTQDWTTVMMEIVMILPLLIASLAFLLGLRKALKSILSLLRQA